MKPIFEIVMKNKNVPYENDNPKGVTRLTVRVEGMDRNSAILFAESLFPEYATFYVMAGPRNEVT